jgi:rubrerythrin
MGGDTEKEILSILEEAIKRERAAHNLYSRGASLAEKSEIKEVFERLAQEELHHEKLLTDIYHGYKKRLGLKVLHPDDE